ncbi:MAG: HAMP domain-containing protein [Deltaproteobacteria bacterium]|nr:HAMP domain-containing protein [Deltaproteobacteria bacterium]MBW2016079.1 HAMP domain-containing protein [Deltaproteobacteria bacterium]MBW2130362.1 HAMP domain-containing protein [Deltaproteobacteria bacterium]
MKTIKGKITTFFVFCLILVGVLTILYYENTMSLRRKLAIIENFDDLLNNTLELRRYEKNLIYYHDVTSLDESVYYLFRIEDASKRFEDDMIRVVGSDDCERFQQTLIAYKKNLERNMSLVKSGNSDVDEEEIRTKGKVLVDIAQKLIRLKRKRIDQALSHSLVISMASLGAFIILILIVFHLVSRGILKPLSLVRRATEQVARDTFTPIAYQEDKKDEISRLIGAFNRMANELETRQEQLLQSRKLASIGTLTSGIAHELNNPINNISLTAETLKYGYNEMGPEEIDELLQDILVQADRASQVVKNLLEFSRTEKPYLRELDLKEVVNKTIKLIKNQVMISGVELATDLPERLPSVKGKRQDLEQAFLNVLVNAIQAMPGGGKLSIRMIAGIDGYIRTDISDTGIGIKPSDMAHIFDPFFTTKEVGKGTGLGLSLVYGIIRTHGGYIEVKSEVNKGTTFSIFLPIAEEGESIEHQDKNSHR